MYLIERFGEACAGGGIPILAKWTTDFDCRYETEWWYCIKDTPFEVTTLKGKRGNEIKKGKKYFDVRKINPADYKADFYSIMLEMNSRWKKSIDVQLIKKGFKLSTDKRKGNIVVLGAFFRGSDELCGFVYLIERTNNVDICIIREKSNYKKFSVSSALIAGVCDFYRDRLQDGSGFYICDCIHNVNRKTAFQDYLEKYFGFRKAYCHLNLLYRKPFDTLVNILMPIRGVLCRIKSISFINVLNYILWMEEIGRIQSNPIDKQSRMEDDG